MPGGHRRDRPRDARPGIDLRWLRRQFIAALAADAQLFERLVLKGGNALDLVHGIGGRTSLELDYSMQGDVENEAALGQRIFDALRSRLALHGLRVFDEKFGRRPSDSKEGQARWGGYAAEFKVVRDAAAESLEGDLVELRKEALTVSGDPQASRRFLIEISKHEHCDPIVVLPVHGDVVCRVYTPALIAAEKLRALCQQMEAYTPRLNPTPRPRDFYDLHAVITEANVVLSEESFHELVVAVFAAKDAPLALLRLLPTVLDFHEEDWPSARDSIPAGKPRDFGFYFEFVISEVRKLEPLWHVDAP